MKKLLSVLLVALMVVSLFANGTSEAPAEPETTTIRYWQHSSAARDAMMERIIAMFEEKYPKKELRVADNKNTIYYIYKEACGTIMAVFGIRN